MSVKNVKAFFEKVEGDKGLQEKLKALDTKVRKNRNEEITEFLKIASAAGFKFTPGDVAKARSQKLKISADEFKTVAGGTQRTRGTKPVGVPWNFNKLCLCQYPSLESSN